MGYQLGVAAIESHDLEAIRSTVEALGFRMDAIEVLEGPDRLRTFGERFYDAGRLRRHRAIGMWRTGEWTQLCSDRIPAVLLDETDSTRLLRLPGGVRVFAAMVSSVVDLYAFGVWSSEGRRRVINPGEGGEFLQEGSRLPGEEWTTRDDFNEEDILEVAARLSLDLEADVADSDWLAIADIWDRPKG